MHYWMLPALPWLVTMEWSRLVWQAALQPPPPAAPSHSATIIPFTRAKRAASA